MIRKIRFVSDRSHFRCNGWHLGLFSFYRRDEGLRRYTGLAIYPRGLLLWFLGCLLFGYVGVVSALFFVWRRDQSLGLRYREFLLLPIRWDSIQQRRAEAAVDKGLHAMKDAHWGDAEMLILSGLQRSPSILAGRTQLAYFYFLTGRWSLGASILSGGFSFRYPGRQYFEEACSLAQEADDFEVCTRWCQQLLTRFGESMPPADRSLLMVREAGFLFTQERYQELSNFTASCADKGNIELRELQVLALLKLGDHAQALAKLDLWQQRHPEEALMIVRLRAQGLRRVGRLNEMAQQLDRACAMAPHAPIVFLDSVTERFEAGQNGPARDALDQFLILFGSEPSSTLFEDAMANFAEIKYADGMDRLLRFARMEKLPLKKMLLLKTVFDLTEGDANEARQLLKELENLWSLDNPRDRTLREFLKLLTEATTDTDAEGRSRLDVYCSDRRLEWGDYSRAARVLARFNYEKAALKVLDVALTRYPSSCHLGALKKKIQAESDAKAKVTQPK